MMRTALIATTFLLGSILSGTGASAAVVQYNESFDSGFGGWSIVDSRGDRNGPQNRLSNPGSGGADGGGFLQIDDVTGGFMYLVAPSALNGDQSSLIGGTLSFSLADFTTRSNRFTDRFGEVTIRSGNRSITADAFAPNPTADWQGASLNLSASAFGVSETRFESIFSNVTSFEITMESRFGLVETVGIDEINISTVPLPPAGAMLAAGLIGLFGWRRMRNS